MIFLLRTIFCLCLQVAFIAVFAQPPACHQRPIIFIHGFLGAGDNFAPLAVQLQAAGQCAGSLVPYDWNTLSRNPKEVNRLDSVVQAALAQSGHTQVLMIGHSAGGSLAYQYLADSLRSQRVAGYVHIGSRAMAAPAGPGGSVPTLHVYSLADRTVPGKDIPCAINLRLHTPDHFGLVTCDSTAAAVLQFAGLQATKKTTTTATGIQLQVLQMGQNQPEAGATLTYQLLLADGSPAGSPRTAVSGADGKATLQLPAPVKQPLWVQCQPVNGRPVAYYFAQVPEGPMPLYLRTLPASGMVNLLLGGIPKTEQPAWVLFNPTQAFAPGDVPLQIGADTLNTPVITPVAKTVVALFLYDSNADGQSSRQPIGLFAQAPFMNGIDYALPPTGTIALQWQGQRWQIPAVASKDFVTVIVL